MYKICIRAIKDTGKVFEANIFLTGDDVKDKSAKRIYKKLMTLLNKDKHIRKVDEYQDYV